MNVKWDVKLKDWQNSNPVLYYETNAYPNKFDFNEADFNSVLDGKGHQLKTWGGAESTGDPHWIGVRKATPLHTDPRYPRYSWQLVLKVDNFGLRGVDKDELHLEDNMLVLLDTHSPHQLFSRSKDAMYYLACSMDSKTLIGKRRAKEMLINFVDNHSLVDDTKRIFK